jgi:hypothetical protein
MEGYRTPTQAEIDASPFSRINPDDMKTLRRVAERAVLTVSQYLQQRPGGELFEVPDLMLTMMDFAIAHVFRELKLGQLLLTSDAEFICEYVLITKAVNRVAPFFPSDVRLAYASK